MNNMKACSVVLLLLVANSVIADDPFLFQYSCDTPVEFGRDDSSIYSRLIFSSPGETERANVTIWIDASTSEPYELQLIYGTSPMDLGTFRNDVFMKLDPTAAEACTDICSNGCGRREPEDQLAVCRPPEGFRFFERVNPGYHPWQIRVKGGAGELVEWRLSIDLKEGGVSAGEKHWGGIFVAVSYLLLTAAFVVMIVQDFRHKSYGMPLVGQAAMLGVTILVVGPGPLLQPCLFDVFIYLPTNFESPTVSEAAKFMTGSTFGLWVWRIGLLIQATVFLQYLLWGRDQPPQNEFQRRYFYQIAFGMLALFTVMEYLYIVFNQDYYVNEIYLVATVIMAASYLVSLITRTEYRGLSVSVGWLWCFGTLFLYVGLIIGHMDEAFHDHIDTGFAYIHALYLVAVGCFAAYSIGLTRRYRQLPRGAGRPAA